MTTCPICQRVAALRESPDSPRFDCMVCGTYLIAKAVNYNWFHARKRNDGKLDPEQEQLLPYLSAATRQAASPMTISVEGWEDIARSQRRMPLDRKLRLFLEMVARGSNVPGDWVPFDPATTPALIGARDGDEVHFLGMHLGEAGYLTGGNVVNPSRVLTDWDLIPGYRLTVSGWEAVQPLAGGVAGTCFVAMSFDPTLTVAYEIGIVPAVETDCGFSVVRVDRVHHNDPITDKIIAGIRSAQFVVADFTMQRQGVYYEAGFALGLGRTVIWTCQEDEKDKLHFDTRQFNHIMWKTPDDLRVMLADRIRATIPGAKAVSI